MLWVASRAFLPDSTRSGRWNRHPSEIIKKAAPGASAADILDLIAPNGPSTEKAMALAEDVETDLHAAPDLEDGTSDVEVPASDVEEDEHEDQRGLDVEMCAAHVYVEQANPRKNADPDEPTDEIRYAPDGWKVLRHVRHGTRHWSRNGKTIICPKGRRDPTPANYAEAVTHEDQFCNDCVVTARSLDGVEDAERLCYGMRR